MYRNLVFILCLGLFSCQKNLPDIPSSKLEVPLQITYRDVHVFNENEFIICGGDDKGYVLKTTNGGNTWIVSQSHFDKPVNAMFFISPDTGFCADSDVIIYKTTDGGISWNTYYATSWPLTVNRNLRDIWFRDASHGFVCGGKNYGNGVLYRTENAGNSWSFEEFTHEYRGICFADENHGVLCGYGSLLITDDGGVTFQNREIKDYYYTGICVDANKKFYLIELNGSIYTSVDFGQSWQKINDRDGPGLNYRKLFTISVSPIGNIAAAGPNGYLIYSIDGGFTWNFRESFDSGDIMKVEWIDDFHLLSVGKDGAVYLTEIN